MSRPCAQCRQPLGELELSLKCANPRCTSLCHPSCASGPLLLNDGGRVPRWRCSECQLVSPVLESGYESVYGRPRAGDTLKRVKDDWAKNRAIDDLHLRNRGHFDRASNYRASTGAILSRNFRPTDLKFALPVRPKSAILTPTPTEDDLEPTKEIMDAKTQPIVPKTTTNLPDNPVPVRLVTPDEKYDETVKSFYKWLEEHECASKDKGGNRGGLVKDKIAQFGAKLEDHLASRNTDMGTDIGRTKVQHPVAKSGSKWGAESHQAGKQPVAVKTVVKSNDPMEGRYYSGKLIEAEQGDQRFGGINQSVRSNPSKYMPIISKEEYSPGKSNIKQRDGDYAAVYANQQELDNISARGREKSPLVGIKREVPNQKPFGGPVNQPVQSNLPKNVSVHTKADPEAMSVMKQHDGHYAAMNTNQPEFSKTVSGHEKSPVLGIQRESVNRQPFDGSWAINQPAQSNIPKQMPVRSNTEYPSAQSNLIGNDGDYGVLYANPQKWDKLGKGQEKSTVGGVHREVGKPNTVEGNLVGDSKGRLIDDGRIYHNTTPVVQRGTQVTEVSSLKPLFGTPKSSLTRKTEISDDEVSQDDEEFPPPPPCLETDLDQLEIQPDIVVKSVESAGSVKDAMVDRKNFNDRVVGNSDAGDDRRGLSVGQETHEDARVVKHTSLPARGTFTLSIVNTNNENQGVLVREVDEGQPCLTCEKCQGFEAHHWRKTCNSCKCPRESHDVFHEEWVNVRERLGIGQDQDKWGSRDRVISQGLAWAPPGLPPYKVDQYFKCLPQDKVPKLGTSGEKYREKQLMIQLPKQDLALAYCRHVEPAHQTSYDDFITARNEIALDIAYAKECTARTDCPECGRSVNPGEVGVLAPKFGDKILWHPSCFICSHCKQLLVDLTYCVHDDYLYCERHYAEQLKPRCSACDELIFSGEYTKAMSKDWHSGHFCCWQCDESLTGQRYVLRDDHPYCIKCYESVFANTCDECNKTIGIDSKDLSYKDKHWHEACFFCNKCRVSLVDKQFGSKADKIYCGNCYDAQFASRCDGCGQIFRAGTKKMEYKTRQWHEQCFCCCVCKSAIGTKSFIPREQEIYCATCYEEKFATRCVKCNKIITSGGVTYKNEPWHRECFTCTNCNTSLAGQRFTSRDEKPYCADCFGELFAKRCTSCCKPITGIGGTRFISFEDRHWHNDCFICASCKTSLVGRGFITDAEDILCTECAKQKLM